MSTEEAVNLKAEEAALFDISDIIEVEDQSFGPVFPIVQWHNGNPQQKRLGDIGYTGGFFISSEQGVEIPGSAAFTLTTSDGTEIPGFSIRDLRGSPIRFRRSWIALPKADGLSIRYPWGGYEDAVEVDYKRSPRGRGQLLFLPDGMEEPVVLTFSGLVAGAIFSQGAERGIIPTFAQMVVNQAKRVARRSKHNIEYPLCAFRMGIGPERDSAGEPTYTMVGTGDQSSRVNMPKWLDRPSSSLDASGLAKLFVGREAFVRNQEIHKSADEWVAAWSPEVLIKNLRRTSDAKREMASVRGEASAPAETGLPADKEIPF